MFLRTRNRRAISTVLTTLIILVASVVLGTGVVLYGTSMFQTSAQTNSLSVTNTAVWADKVGSGWAWGAADVRNSGDKILSMDTITVRGQNIPFSNWYTDTNAAQVTIGNFQQQLNYTTLQIINSQTALSVTGAMANGTGYSQIPVGCTNTAAAGTLIMQLGAAVNNPPLCLQVSTGPFSLSPGATAIVYFKLPQNILTTLDAGSSASVGIYAGSIGGPQTITVQSK